VDVVILGTKIAHYVVETELGRGGMGVVYRAKYLQLNRMVALKLLSEEYVGHGEQRQMILAEARVAVSLNHPGITTIYEVGEHEGQLYIAMELVARRTMRALLQEGAFKPRRLIRFATQVAEALEAVHSNGVRHGDVKPENIVVQADDRIKLLDFGLASRVMEVEVVTTTGSTTRII
jgi:serine/threonine protein kinase